MRGGSHKLIKEGKIKPIKLGKSTRFDKKDLDDFIEKAKKGFV